MKPDERRGRYGGERIAAFMACLLLAAALHPSAARPAGKGNKEPARADFRKGALHGRVVDAAARRPIPDATVAILDAKGRVTAWTRTGSDGRYAIAADSLALLRLKPSKRKGLLARMVGGVGAVAMAPVRIGVSVVETTVDVANETFIKGAKGTATAVVKTAITGNPVPVASRVAESAVNVMKNNYENGPPATVVEIARSDRLRSPKTGRKTLLPGETLVQVSAPGYREAKGVAGAVWMEPEEEADGRRVGARVWLETAQLAATDGEGASSIPIEAILLSDAGLEPNLAPPGATVKVRVKLEVPDGLFPSVRVFAREPRRRQVIELKPRSGGVYEGVLTLDPKMPVGTHKVSVLALREDPVEVKLPRGKEDPLLRFARDLDEMTPGTRYDFDPRIMASENRLDMELTVLDPKLFTPTGK